MTSPITPSPDMSGYVDLRVYDRSDQQIVDTVLAQLQLAVPELVIREGAIEVLLIELFALATSEAVVAINRLPGAVVEAILHLAGVDRDYGSAAFTAAEFTFGDLVGHTVPPGTRLFLTLDSGTSVGFLVEEPGLTVPPGSSTGSVDLVSAENTAAANGVSTGTLQLVDPLGAVDTVVLDSPVLDGRDPETVDQWRDRGVRRLARLSDALVTPRHFEDFARERAEVTVAVALDNYNAPLGSGSPGDHPGHISIAVLGAGGVALSAPAKSAIAADMEERAHGALVIHVVDVATTAIDVVLTVHLLDGADSATTLQAVEDAIAARLDPITWPGGQVIRRNELVALADGVPGVDWVGDGMTIEGATANYTLATAQTLPTAGVITATAV